MIQLGLVDFQNQIWHWKDTPISIYFHFKKYFMSKALCEGLLEVEKENKQKKAALLKSSCLLIGIYFLFMKSFDLGGFQLKVL